MSCISLCFRLECFFPVLNVFLFGPSRDAVLCVPLPSQPSSRMDPVALLMPKNWIAIYELLFKEGVPVAKKDDHMPKHPELADKNVCPAFTYQRP